MGKSCPRQRQPVFSPVLLPKQTKFGGSAAPLVANSLSIMKEFKLDSDVLFLQAMSGDFGFSCAGAMMSGQSMKRLSVSGVDVAGARTVVTVSDHMVSLRDAATHLQSIFDTRERGYFSPSEDEQVEHLWVSYHGSRAALLEIVQAIRNEVSKASREQIGEFALAYAATLTLVDAARSLRDLFGKNDLVRRKLNEAFDDFRIPAGSFDEIQLSLTDPGNALQIKNANEFFEQNHDYIRGCSEDDETLATVVEVIEKLRDATDVGKRKYLKARVKELGRNTRDRVLLGSLNKAIYAIRELGGRAVANLSTSPEHVPALPTRIADQIQDMLQPGDVLVTRKEHAMSNYFLPGYWPHVAMYVGDQRVVESMKDGVRVREMSSPFGNDSVAVIRPVLDQKNVKQAILRARSHVGKPYDFDFDFTRADRLVCTEVVYRSYEGLGEMEFSLVRRAGRQTVSAEDLLGLALQEQNFQAVAVYCCELSEDLLSGDAMRQALRKTMGLTEKKVDRDST